MSLRAKFLTLFALCAVVPLVAVGIFDYVYSMRTLEALIASQVNEIAARAATQLRRSYALRESELLLLTENAETQRLYRALTDGDPSARDEALDGAGSYLRQAWNVLSPYYARIEFRDANGSAIYRLPMNASDRSAVLGGAPTPYRADVMSVVRPIYDQPSGREVGTLYAALDLDELLPYEQLAARFGETGYSTVVDRSRNTVLYHPSHAYRRQSLGRLLGPDGWNVDPSLIEEEHGTLVYREGDTTRVAAFASLAEPPWTIFAAGSTDEFAAPIARMRARNLIIVFVVAAAIAFAFTLMTRRETRSLLALAAAADQVGAGSFDPELPSDAGGEVGRLSEAFRLMIARLRETLKQIEASRQMAAVGAFASQISHEIRNPLTSLKLNLQSLARDAKSGRIPAESARPVEISLREIERLDQVVSGVLSLGRPRSTAREPITVGELVRDALEVVEPQLVEQGIEVETDYRGAGDAITGNVEELKAALLNLFLNAVEAMPGGGTLRVSTRRIPRANAVEIRVADEGPGIPSEVRDEIFRPFFSSKRTGTGLGLSLALRTVEEHGGTLTLAEPPRAGRGAEFVVMLPLDPGVNEP
ncbi:MAG: HAMP domain-containing protein [Gemmatimonadetes bacterium]|uniref:Signal transduction histidine-protein kinase/phosphatase MprB n=1 Tax=Candidatus Kutchimonas denitrificans TaxID=3056748 RepID=A0AAE4ZBA8_9BACT|nr:HAMP domain-containing protein [Gemmatimonadota bacterium]NIR74305.1 HAMP domain-containing protein [Candidatus Kutchimonas denitrificans]NIS02560.1 HAMP domain-containing protein [Gemmatimonadota bacterium]NIT68436.1 HAMP domain-containing protein [Gemmatimonadota bacterium]NIU51888.1 HAMP domain-containing protein [Gemmatimonadota bacterium]